MALEFIDYKDIIQGKKISVPNGANCFRTKSGQIKFFKVNPCLGDKTYEIPKGVKEMSFEDLFETIIDIGEPVAPEQEEVWDTGLIWDSGQTPEDVWTTN